MPRPAPPVGHPPGWQGGLETQAASLGQALGVRGPARKHCRASSPLIVMVNREAGVTGCGGGGLRVRRRPVCGHMAALAPEGDHPSVVRFHTSDHLCFPLNLPEKGTFQNALW